MSTGRTRLISEESVLRLPEGSELVTTVPYVITPSAVELIRKRGIRIVEQPGAPANPPEISGLAGYLESTRLDAAATPENIETLCLEAATAGFAGICVNPIFVPQAAALLAGSPVRTISVCGFPLGASRSATKACEARQAAADGAHEIDMVMALGPFLAGDFARVEADIREVRSALEGADTRLKVIIEAPLLSPTQIVQASVLALAGGADFVKTGTGFRGAARPEDVALIRRTVGDQARIKAAGGIRDRKLAQALIEAGADRLGTSHARDLL